MGSYSNQVLIKYSGKWRGSERGREGRFRERGGKRDVISTN